MSSVHEQPPYFSRLEAVNKGYAEHTKGLNAIGHIKIFDSLTDEQGELFSKIFNAFSQKRQHSLTLDEHEIRTLADLEKMYVGEGATGVSEEIKKQYPQGEHRISTSPKEEASDELKEFNTSGITEDVEFTPEETAQIEARLKANEEERLNIREGKPSTRPPELPLATSLKTPKPAPASEPETPFTFEEPSPPSLEELARLRKTMLSATPGSKEQGDAIKTLSEMVKTQRMQQQAASAATSPAITTTEETKEVKQRTSLIIASKIKAFFKKHFIGDKTPNDQKVENSEKFLRTRHMEGGKFKDPSSLTPFSEKDSDAMSEGGVSRGAFVNVGLGLGDQLKRNDDIKELQQARAALKLARANPNNISSQIIAVDATVTEQQQKASELLTEATNNLQTFHRNILNRFEDLENGLKPYLKNPRYAAEYAGDLLEHAKFLREEGIEDAEGLREKAKLWALYAAERGDQRALLIIADHYATFEDWSSKETRKATVEMATKFTNMALKGTHKEQAHLVEAALYEKQMLHAAAEGLFFDPTDLSPINKKASDEFRLAGALAVKAYLDAGPEGGEGLYRLFLMGSTEAGIALVKLMVNKTNITPKDAMILRILSDAGIEDASLFALLVGLDKIKNENINKNEEQIDAQVAQHQKNQLLWKNLNI